MWACINALEIVYQSRVYYVDCYRQTDRQIEKSPDPNIMSCVHSSVPF